MNDIASLLTALLGRLCRTVGGVMAAQAHGPQLVWLGTRAFAPIPQPNQPAALPNETWFLLTQRLGRLAHRFRTLFARHQAGTLPTPRARPSSFRASTPYPRLPAAHGWINLRIPAVAPCAGTLDMLLQTPEMRDFVTAAPQAGRVLRPLSRMLGLTLPPWLRLPPRPKPSCSPLALVRSEPDGGPSVAEPNSAPPPTPFRPIPPNILAAARAWRSKTR